MTEQQTTNGVSERTLKLLDAALILQQVGEQGLACQVLLKARDDAPAYPPVYLLLSSTYRSQSDWGAMEAALRKVLDLEAGNKQALQALGLLLVSRGRPEEGIPLLKRHLRLAPDNLESGQALSSALLEAGKTSDARRVLADVWKSSGTEEAGVQYARLLILLRQLKQAEDLLRELAQKYPTPRVLVQLATALSLRHKYAESARILEGVVQRDPNEHRAWRSLAYVYDALERCPEALEAAERAIQLNDANYRNWHAKARVLLHLERYADAAQAAQRAIELIHKDAATAGPLFFDLLLMEVDALQRLGRNEEALQRLDESRRQFPTETEPVVFEVELLHDLKRTEEALPVLAEAQAAGVEVALGRYTTLHRLGRPADALEAVRTDLEAEPRSRKRLLGHLCDIGQDLYGEGNFAAARAVFTQVHELAPQEPRYLNNLAFLLVGEGKCEDAEQAFRRVLALPDSEEFQALVWLNLGYLYLIRGAFEQARQALQEVDSALAEHKAQADEETITRVAYWRNEQVVPEYTPYPRAWCRTRLGLEANRVALLLAEGQISDAEAVARGLVRGDRYGSLGYRVLGSVLLAQEKTESARQAWKRAIERADLPEERSALEEWVASLV